MEYPNITMEEYIRLEEERARRRGKVYNWETVTYAYSTLSSIRRIQFTEYGVLSYLIVFFQENLLQVKMEYPNITMEEYIRLEEERARRRACCNIFRVEYSIWHIQFLGYEVKMEYPNITMEEYIRLEEERARRRGKVYNWETVTYVSPLNDNKFDFRISFDESDDKDYTHDRYVVFVKRIQRIRHRYQYGVSWGMDTTYRLPVQF
uniref:Uncharacterized protein n=1 Tax=Tanacetum cinerariifolium TaxID=118510 RepID=A0A6L2M8R3_TANCI|nr:hypothetical protein [Tanacetum cinerariifolium]